MMRHTTLEASTTGEPPTAISTSELKPGATDKHQEAPAEPALPVVVKADGLGKRYKIYKRPTHRLREWILGGTHHTDFWAIRNISFEVRRGECMGIIGANGSGKSTLLKMIAGALRPSEGSFHVAGRVLSLIELGTGLNPMLTGRANIVHAATLLGFPANFAREKMSEIESFAELGEFFERPVNLYSSGMRVRLAFSMFACFRPELFIVDEALSVGDIFFQQKCATRIRELLETGMTMLFVSHDQSAILNLCDRAMVLSQGSAVFYGEPEEAITCYVASLRTEGRIRGKWQRRPEPVTGKNAAAQVTTSDGMTAAETGQEAPAEAPPVTDSEATAAPAETSPRPMPAPARPISGGPARQIIARDVIRDRRHHRHGNGKLLIHACRITTSDGRDTARAAMGDTLVFHVLIEAQDHMAEPRAGIRFFDRFNNLVFAAGTFQLHRNLPPLAPGDQVIVRFEVKMDVAPGQYTFGLGTGEPAPETPQEGIACDRIDLLGPITIGNPEDGHRTFFGTARLPMTIRLQRIGTPERLER